MANDKKYYVRVEIRLRAAADWAAEDLVRSAMDRFENKFEHREAEVVFLDTGVSDEQSEEVEEEKYV